MNTFVTILHRFFLTVDVFCDNMAPFWYRQDIQNGPPVFGLTLSAHAQMAKMDGHKWGIYLMKVLELINPGHGPDALQATIDRAEANKQEVQKYLNRLKKETL